MAGTTMPGCRRRLVDLIAAHPDAPGCEYSMPTPEEMGLDWIYVANVASGEVSDPVLKAGRRRRDEVYVFEVVAGSMVRGGDQEAADGRATLYLRAIDETVADHPTLDGASLTSDQQVISVSFLGWESAEGPTDAGHAREFVARVQVWARLL